MRARSFAATLDVVRPVEGWMTDDQARRLWDRAGAVRPGGRVVEIGSYQGRSTIVLASAVTDGVEVIAIDPHAGNDRGPQQFDGPPEAGQGDHERFNANLESAGVAGRVRHIRRPSQDAGAEVDGEIDLLYIDGAHRLRPARRDVTEWGTRVAPDATMLIHDSFSSVGVTLALMVAMFFGSDFTYLGRVGSMAEYRRTPVGGRDRARNAARQIAELPWFARNVVIKVLILARLGGLTRLLGHTGGNWPY